MLRRRIIQDKTRLNAKFQGRQQSKGVVWLVERLLSPEFKK